MKRRIILLMVLLNILLTGCEIYDHVESGDTNYPPVEPYPYKHNSKFKVYYPDKNSNHLVIEKRKVKDLDRSLEEYLIDELLKGTTNPELITLIPKGTKLISVEVIGQIAYVNFSDELINLKVNEREEAFVLYSIVNTLTQLKKINKVQIFIEGERKDIFYKHYAIGYPLEPTSLIVEQEYMSPMSVVIDYYDKIKDSDYYAMIALYAPGQKKDMRGLLKSEFQELYGDLEEYIIKDYYMDNYGDKIRLVVDIELRFSNKDEVMNQQVFLLNHKEGTYRIREHKRKDNEYREISLLQSKSLKQRCFNDAFTFKLKPRI